MAIRLQQEGMNDFVVLERAADLGGTWCDNHYPDPGLCCDIPSHVYSFSFELNRLWTRGFAPGQEILAYLRDTASRYGVLRHIRYEHEVTAARWDAAAERWEIETTRGRFNADVLVSAAGHRQSWYLDDTGQNTTLWPGWTFDFRRRTRRFDPESYVLESRTNRVAVG